MLLNKVPQLLVLHLIYLHELIENEIVVYQNVGEIVLLELELLVQLEGIYITQVLLLEE